MQSSENIPFQKKNSGLERSASLLFLFLFYFVILSLPKDSFAQVDSDIVPQAASTTASIKVRAEVLNGDTVPVIDLSTVYVYTEYVFKNVKQREQWTRIKRDIKVVYPYAILAAAKLKEYDVVLDKMPEEHKKAYLRVCEKDLKNEFEDELKDLSINQGRLLMKLIDRETGKTTYDIVKQMRGTFQVVMWQAVARLFGNDMKVSYDPVEDIMIERAIKQVESGNLVKL